MIRITASQLEQFTNKVSQTAEIISPIRSIGIVGAFYSRIYTDGTIINLGSDVNSITFCLNQLQAGNYQPESLLCNIFPQPGIHLSEFNLDSPLWQDVKHRFHYGNGIVFCSEHDNFKEVLSFYSTADNQKINNFYINHLEELKEMRGDFLFHATPLIEQCEKERRSFPLAIFPQNHFASNKSTRPFLNLHKPDVVDTKNKSDVYFESLVLIHKKTRLLTRLPPQRGQCLLHLFQGKSVKEIARAMKLSPKTIEYYLGLLRKELACHSSKELISSYSSQV